MVFNPSKCKTICISNKKLPIQNNYVLYGIDLEKVDSISYLGVTLTSNLKWYPHISTITGKANKVLGMIRRNLWSCPFDVKVTAYLSLVRPKLEYACQAWDPHFKKDIASLERVQRKAARFCSNNYHRTASVTKMLSDLEWDSLDLRRKIWTASCCTGGFEFFFCQT